MNNITIVSLSSSIPIGSTENYDTIGAIVFIVFVLFWYSLSTAFLLGIQTMTHGEIHHDSMRYSKEGFTRHSHEKFSNKRILEELVDKEKREKLWRIYLGTSTGLNEQMNQADTLRVRHIQRQLALIAKNTRNEDLGDERIESIANGNLNDSNIESASSEILDIGSRLRVRRQSETNQEILEQWQAAVKDLKMMDKMPWTVQKLMIKRQLRRQRRLDPYGFPRKSSSP